MDFQNISGFETYKFRIKFNNKDNVDAMRTFHGKAKAYYTLKFTQNDCNNWNKFTIEVCLTDCDDWNTCMTYIAEDKIEFYVILFELFRWLKKVEKRRNSLDAILSFKFMPYRELFTCY